MLKVRSNFLIGGFDLIMPSLRWPSLETRPAGCRKHADTKPLRASSSASFRSSIQAAQAIATDIQLQHFFDKLIPAFNHVNGKRIAHRFPTEVKTATVLQDVLKLFIWQFSVQRTVLNNGAYNHAAIVPNASTLMYPLTSHKPSSQWTARRDASRLCELFGN
jgi:hypothetical protein